MSRGRRLPDFLRPAEISALLLACRSIRERLIVMLGLGCGLRCAEITHLAIEHLDLAAGVLLVYQGKGKKDRYVPLPAILAAELRAWTAFRSSGWLFAGRRPGQPMTTRAIQHLADRLKAAAGIQRRCNPHTWRHTYATQLLGAGASLTDVQALLGHTSPMITARYLHADVSRLRGAVDRLTFGQLPANGPAGTSTPAPGSHTSAAA